MQFNITNDTLSCLFILLTMLLFNDFNAFYSCYHTALHIMWIQQFRCHTKNLCYGMLCKLINEDTKWNKQTRR